VINSGGGTLTLSVTVSPSPPFSVVSGQTLSLGPEEQGQVHIGFRPTTTGDVTGTATITSNGGSQTVELRGKGG